MSDTKVGADAQPATREDKEIWDQMKRHAAYRRLNPIDTRTMTTDESPPSLFDGVGDLLPLEDEK